MAAAEQVSTDELMCPICREVRNEVKVLSCIHTSCEQCLEQLYISQESDCSISCPVCRTVCPVPNGDISNLTTKQATAGNDDDGSGARTEKVSYTRCSLCDTSGAALAEIYCQNCANPLCPSCLTVHNDLYGETEHRVVTLQQIQCGEEQILTPCEVHSQELKEYICLGCRQYLCILCRLSPVHNGHNIVEFKDFGENLKADLSLLQSRVNENVDDITQYIEYLDQKKPQMTADIELQKQRIGEAYQECVDRLMSVRDDLWRDCDQFKEKLFTELDDKAQFQRIVLESIKEQSIAVENFAETALLKQSIPNELPRQYLEKMLDNIKLDLNKADEIARRASNMKFYPSRETGDVEDLHLGTVEMIETDNA